MSEILDVDLLAFETGIVRAASCGRRRSRQEPADRVRVHRATTCPTTCSTRPTACCVSSSRPIRRRSSSSSYRAPTARPATPGSLVETAASSDQPDWKEMLNWSTPIPAGHPLKRKFSTAYPDQVLPESAVPGITEVLYRVPRCHRRPAASIPPGDRRGHRLPRDVLRRHGRRRTHPDPGDSVSVDARTVPGDGHVWAAEHGDINLITALPRATAPGLQVKVDDELGRRRRTRRPGDHQHRASCSSGSPTVSIPIGWHRVVACTRIRRRALQRGAVLPSPSVDRAVAGSELLHRGASAAVQRPERRRCTRRGALRDQPRRRSAAGRLIWSAAR